MRPEKSYIMCLCHSLKAWRNKFSPPWLFKNLESFLFGMISIHILQQTIIFAVISDPSGFTTWNLLWVVVISWNNYFNSVKKTWLIQPITWNATHQKVAANFTWYFVFIPNFYQTKAICFWKNHFQEQTKQSSYLIDWRIFHFNYDLEVSDAWNVPQTMSWVL